MSPNNCDKCGHDKNMCVCAKNYVAQEGGSHYQSSYQHWDWVVDMSMPYLPASATKYVARWRKKNGIQDLIKAMSYIEKMITTYDKSFDKDFRPAYRHRTMTDEFIRINDLQGLDAGFMICMSGPRDMAMIELAKQMLQSIISEAKRTSEGAGSVGASGGATTPTLPQGDIKQGAAGGIVGQGPATSTSTELHNGRIHGMEHPFGYDQHEEGLILGFNSVRTTKTDEGYNG